jgi:hypothetical protein
VRGVTREQHPAMAEAVDAAAGELVDRDPLELEVGVGPEHGPDARQHLLGLLFLFGVGVPAELEVDAPDVVACLCSSTLWPRWKGGSNQNQRSVGKAAFITTSAIRKRSWKNCP